MMTEMLRPELGVAPPETNQVEQAVAEQFGAPELWSQERHVRMRAGRLAGLKPSPADDFRYTYTGEPEKAWVTLLYGSRVSNNDGSRWGSVEFETTTLETMTEIHANLAQTVLAGEHARPSTFVDPPKAKWIDIGRNPVNNLFWLQQLQRGIWPIMATGEISSNGEKHYFSHDYGDYHNALCLLLPRESQDLITQVAYHEESWFSRHLDGEVPRLLELPDDADKDPFAAWRWGNAPYTNGLDIIDKLTETGSYINLLHYLMHGEGSTPEVRMKNIEAYIESGREDYTIPIEHAASGLRQMKVYTAVMKNFISRHETGQNTTQEAVDAAFGEFKTGVLRVAHKLIGNYIPSLDELESELVSVG